VSEVAIATNLMLNRNVSIFAHAKKATAERGKDE